MSKKERIEKLEYKVEILEAKITALVEELQLKANYTDVQQAEDTAKNHCDSKH